MERHCAKHVWRMVDVFGEAVLETKNGMSVNISLEQPLPKTIGETLREARKAKGLSIDQLAQDLCMSTRHVEALEADDIKALPELVFALGFVRSIASYLDLDDVELAAQFREAHNLVRCPVPQVKDAQVPRQKSHLGLLTAAAAALALALIWAWVSGASTGDDRANHLSQLQPHEAAILKRVSARAPLDLSAVKPGSDKGTVDAAGRSKS